MARDAIEELAAFLFVNPSRRAIRAALIGEREKAIEAAARIADERGGYTAAEIANIIRRDALKEMETSE